MSLSPRLRSCDIRRRLASRGIHRLSIAVRLDPVAIRILLRGRHDSNRVAIWYSIRRRLRRIGRRLEVRRCRWPGLCSHPGVLSWRGAGAWIDRGQGDARDKPKRIYAFNHYAQVVLLGHLHTLQLRAVTSGGVAQESMFREIPLGYGAVGNQTGAFEVVVMTVIPCIRFGPYCS